MGDPSTYPKRKLEVGCTSGHDRNRFYCISNTTFEDMWGVGTSQSGSSHQSSVVHVIVQEQVQTETTQLSAKIA